MVPGRASAAWARGCSWPCLGFLVCGVWSRRAPARAVRRLEHVLRGCWAAACMVTATLGSHTGLTLHPFPGLPQGKVRVEVFMGLGTRQALGCRVGCWQEWGLMVPSPGALDRKLGDPKGRDSTLMPFPEFHNLCSSTFCIPGCRKWSNEPIPGHQATIHRVAKGYQPVRGE